MEFQLSCFKPWKIMLWKCWAQYANKFGKLSSDHRTGKGQFHSNPKERQCQRILKLPHNCTHLTHSCSKFSKPGFSNMSTVNFQMVRLLLEKAEEPEIKLPTSVGSWKKQESSRKTSTSACWLCHSLWLCGSQQTGKFFKRWEYQTTWPASWETYIQVRK